MHSLDPRINRWSLQPSDQKDYGNPPLDQLPTYEVFLQLKEGKAFEHVGIVHAATSDMAFIFAKEQFSRRYTCTGMWVVATDLVWVSDYMDMEDNIYDRIDQQSTGKSTESKEEAYHVFHLSKRGKQHKHVGQVLAKNLQQALQNAKNQFDTGKAILNVWLIKVEDIQSTSTEDRAIWSTLREKTHREVISYRAGDKLEAFKKQSNDQ